MGYIGNVLKVLFVVSCIKRWKKENKHPVSLQKGSTLIRKQVVLLSCSAKYDHKYFKVMGSYDTQQGELLGQQEVRHLPLGEALRGEKLTGSPVPASV